MKSGRRSGGVSTTDVLGVGTQLNGRSSVNSLDEPAEAEELGELFTINDVFSNDTEDPGQIAARKLDWQAFIQRLTRRERALDAWII